MGHIIFFTIINLNMHRHDAFMALIENICIGAFLIFIVKTVYTGWPEV